MKMALLFPEQGFQNIVMSKLAYDNCAQSREAYDEISEYCGQDITKLCFFSSEADLKKSENLQLAVFASSMANYRFVLQYIGLPSFLIGYGMGEITALTASGVLEVKNAVYVIKEINRLMKAKAEKTNNVGVAVVGAKQEVIEIICKQPTDDPVYISAYNSHNQIILSGTLDAIENITPLLIKHGMKIVLLRNGRMFRNPCYTNESELLYHMLQTITFHDLKCSVFSSITGIPYNNVQDIPKILSEQLIRPVQWASAIRHLSDKGLSFFIDIGPGSDLKSLSSCGGIPVYAIEHDLEKIKTVFEEKIEQLIKYCMVISVCTPNRDWDNTKYQKGGLESYSHLEILLQSIKQNKRTDYEQLRQDIYDIILSLKSILQEKKISQDEQNIHLRQLIQDVGFVDVISGFIAPSY